MRQNKEKTNDVNKNDRSVEEFCWQEERKR